MILVDTNVIIDFWKRPNQKKIEIFENNEIAICPVVKAELICGARSEKDKKKIIEALDEMIMLMVDEDDWDYLSELLYDLRRAGITVPFQDVLIATVSIGNDCLLWTYDNHFKDLCRVVKNLKLLETFT